MKFHTLVIFAASFLASVGPLAFDRDFALAAGLDVAPAASPASLPSPNLALSPQTLPYVGVHAVGHPRVSKHPNVTWDQEDIDHYKEMLRSSPELRVQLEDLRRRMDQVVEQSVSIPQPERGPDGAWLFPGDYFPPFPGFPGPQDPWVNFNRFVSKAAEEVSDLGTAYALTGEERYAKHARDILIGYSNCSRYGAPPNMTKRSVSGLTGMLFTQGLLVQLLSRGYDLISTSPSVSAEDRVRIHDELLRPLAAEMLYPSAPDRDPELTAASQVNNRGALASAAVLMAGYATDDQELVNAALYGVRSTINPNRSPAENVEYHEHIKQFPAPKDWTVATADNPSAGLTTVFFAQPAIPDGMWVEGSPGYTFYALGSLVNAAEAAWRHGLDLYSYNNAIFKHLFDYPLLFAYPDLTLPAENDSHRESLLTPTTASLYEYAYRRYQDRRYLAVINSPGERAYLRSLGSTANSKLRSYRLLKMLRVSAVPPSFLYDLSPYEEPAAIKTANVNYAAVGFGIFKLPSAAERNIENLILSYGPSASHGHPDKLHIDLFAFDDVLMPSPGINFPYAGNPLVPNWYQTTLAHNTLVVDEGVQVFHQHNPKLPDVFADQTVYGPAESMGLQRAWTDTAYPGVRMDRSVFLNGWYLADLFSAVSDKTHTYDLAWHIRGAPTSDLALAPTPFPDPVPVGYNQLLNVRQSQPTSGAWTITSTLKDHQSRLLAAAGEPTRAIVGDGGVYVDLTSDEPNRRPSAPTILQRREDVRSTIFGNVLDLSGKPDGYVKSVAQSGEIDAGFAALQIDTADGRDLCFASYRPGDFATKGLETNALQAFVSSNRSGPRALYLGGGTTMKVEGAALTRSEPGLAYVETTQDGHMIVANPSPTPATVTVTLKALQGLEAFHLDSEGQPKGKAEVADKGAATVSLRLEANTRVGFFPTRRP